MARKSDILFIGFQETLNEDFLLLKRILNLPDEVTLPDDDVVAHRNPAGVDKRLDDQATRNLKAWYRRDYQFLGLCQKIAAQIRGDFEEACPGPSGSSWLTLQPWSDDARRRGITPPIDLRVWTSALYPKIDTLIEQNTSNAFNMNTERRQPIFIVGFPRSGTTLLAGMFGAHSKMICGPETEFFTGLEMANRGNRLCRAATWPEEAANYLFSIVHEKPIPDYYGITRDEIISYLKQRERSRPAILESLTETYMKRHGKQRWSKRPRLI